jgi:hypothetical protein
MAEISFEVVRGAILFTGGILGTLFFLFGLGILAYSDKGEYRYHQRITRTLLDALRGTTSGGRENPAMQRHGLVVHRSNVWMAQSTPSDEAIDAIFDK